MFYGDGKNYAPGFGPKKPMEHELGKRPEFSYDLGQIGRDHATAAQIQQGWGAGLARNVTGTSNMATSTGAHQGPMPNGQPLASYQAPAKRRGDTFNDNGRTLYYDDKSSTYLGKSSYDQLYGQPQQKTGLMSAAKAPQAKPADANYRPPGESAANAIGLDWDQQYRDMSNQLTDDTARWRANASTAAGQDAARRGLLSGGASGIAQQGQIDINREAMKMQHMGNRDIRSQLFGQQMQHKTGVAGMKDSYALGIPSALLPMLNLGLNQESQRLQNQGAMLGNQFSERTMDARVGSADEAYTQQRLASQMGQMDVNQRAKLFDTAIQTALAEGRMTEAEAAAAVQMQQRNGEWWNQPWFKDLQRAGLVVGGAVAGGVMTAGNPLGIMAGASAGGSAAGGIR